MLDRIFDPYFTTKENGVGLGLAIAYSIISKHNGCITVDSTEGKGSVFSIYLPAAKNAEQKQVTVKTDAPEASRAGVARILLMDDEPLIRKATVMSCGAWDM